MEIHELASGEILVLGLKGRLDALSADAAKQNLLAKVTDSNPRLVLDLSQLGYVSSAGLRVFLEVSKRVTAAQGKLALCGLVRNVRQVFELAGFASFISIYPDQDEARAGVQSST
jgi:anti-anti-sigma factor